VIGIHYKSLINYLIKYNNQKQKMNSFKIYLLLVTLAVALPTEINGSPAQKPGAISQLSYLFENKQTETMESTVVKAVEGSETKEKAVTPGQPMNILENFAWLDEVILYLVGLLSRFLIQITRKFIFRQDIPWSSIF